MTTPAGGPFGFAVFVVRRSTTQLTSLAGALLELDLAAVVSAVGRIPEVVESVADLVATASRVAADVEPVVARVSMLADQAGAVVARATAVSDQVESVVGRAQQVSEDIGSVIVRATDISTSAESAVALTRVLIAELEKLVNPLRSVIESFPPDRLRGILARGEAALEPLPSALVELQGEVVPAVRALAGLVPAVTSLSLDVERLHSVVGDVSSMLTGIPGAARLIRRSQETRSASGSPRAEA